MSRLHDALASLPVMALAEPIGQALVNGNVVLQAEPGAGKSTGLPLALLDRADLPGRIILLEPRRLAARMVAERLAWLSGEPLGQRIGLRMRAETRVSAQTQLEVVTEGVLTRMLQRDPSLEGVSLLIFDEFHERSLQADLALALSLEVQRALREDLRLLLMSATLQSDALVGHVNAVSAFHCPVRQHPVTILWQGESRLALEQQVVRTLKQALAERQGDVLVFMPGVREINRVARLLQGALPAAVDVHVLHGGVSMAAQRKATEAARADVRRVILSTSLAETSITIDGVRVVLDAGLERRGRQDGVTGAQRLETVQASQASAIQRAGRAGRTSSGWCYRLCSEENFVRRSAHWQPEILRSDLTSVVLETGLWGLRDPRDLPWLDVPGDAGLNQARALLQRLGLWEGDRPSEQGLQVASLPVHPRIGAMLLWAASRGALALATTMAVLLEQGARAAGGVDLEPLLAGRLDRQLEQRRVALSKQIAALDVKASPSVSSVTPALLLVRAFPDWIAQRRDGPPGRFRLACGAGVSIDEQDALAHEPWLAVAELGGAERQLRIFRALALDIEALQQTAGELFVRERRIGWDEKQDRVRAESCERLGQLTINVKPLTTVSADERAEALLQGIRLRGLDCLPWQDEAREWQARVRRISALTLPAGVEPFPPVEDAWLMEHLEHWLLPWLAGIGSLKALQQLDLSQVLCGLLGHAQQRLLDDWMPMRYSVPSGSRIRIGYREPGNPVLSVRLQEMLGCRRHPSIADGRIPLKLALLSPAQRPVQITEDLPGFWQGSYTQVRKEMAGRYPKHVWPDDPMNAEPTRRARTRRR